MPESPPSDQHLPRILLAKTSLDGHWRGVTAVGQALRDAGLEVVALGMARPDEILAAAIEEDVDIIGLNVGGRVAVVNRILDALHLAHVTLPVIAGGTIPPGQAKELEARGVRVFPPGSKLQDIVEAAIALGNNTSLGENTRDASV